MKISGMQLFLENDFVEQGAIEIEKGKIMNISNNETAGNEEHVLKFPASYKCLPGMVDGHIHGAAGFDTMDATPEALNGIAKILPAEGTTSFLATTMTQSPERIEKALKNAEQVIQSQPSSQAEILGIHLEGPFLSKEKAGAQPADYIKEADVGLFKRWQTLAGGHIKCVTVAPEINNGLELIRYLSQQGIMASVGHSNGTFQDVKDAVTAGAAQITHLYNGMSGVHHREPGVAGAALLLEPLKVEMIVDGIHIHPEMVGLSYRLLGSSRTILITDAMRAKCLNEGSYELGGQAVEVKNGKALLPSGQLAGSVLKMNEAIRNMMTFTGAELADIIVMGAVNPAKQLNVFHRKGSIAIGKDADLIILNEQNELVMTFCRGEITYKKEAAND